jgi:hypothetical protein
LNEHEMLVARGMLRVLPAGTFTERSIMLADGNYDAHDLHKDVARLGGRLVSSLTCYGGGLGPLPAFVRRLPRVTRRVGVKIILYHTRLILRKQREINAA